MYGQQFAPWREPPNLTAAVHHDTQQIVMRLRSNRAVGKRLITDMLPMLVNKQLFGLDKDLQITPPDTAEFIISLCQSLFRTLCTSREPVPGLGSPAIMVASFNMLAPVDQSALLTAHLNHPIFNPSVTDYDIRLLCELTVGLHIARAIQYAHDLAREAAEATAAQLLVPENATPATTPTQPRKRKRTAKSNKKT